MILNYYQAIDLMSCLPMLLAPVEVKANPVLDSVVEEEDDHTLEMMPHFTPQLEANGSIFY
jgi:hypothetical protein